MTGKKLTTAIAVTAGLAVVGSFFFMNGPLEAFRGVGSAALGDANMQVVTQDVKVGTGEEATLGKVLRVNYVGRLQNGAIFDASANHGGPYEFTLGAGQVISGWDQGLVGMKVGGQRIVVIPPALGYGSNQIGPVPPDSTLIFQVELVGVSSPEEN